MPQEMISESIQQVRAALPEGVTLVAVSKTHPASAIMEAYGAGLRDFGENKVQEMTEKQCALPGDIRWHMIGHLQTNKVKYVVPYVHLVHSVDSVRLLAAIDKEARKVGRVVDCLLQVHVASEQTKFGFAPDELRQLALSGGLDGLPNVRVRGVMAMATNTDDQARVEADFENAARIFADLRRTCFAASAEFSLLSMGMSDDYHVAVRHGANIVRVGSRIFGQRHYAE